MCASECVCVCARLCVCNCGTLTCLKVHRSRALRSGMAISGTANYEIEVPCNCNSDLGIHNPTILALDHFGICHTLLLPGELYTCLKAPAGPTPASGAASYSSQLALQRKSGKHHQTFEHFETGPFFRCIQGVFQVSPAFTGKLVL